MADKPVRGGTREQKRGRGGRQVDSPARLREVRDLVRACYSQDEICDFCAPKWKCSRSTVARLVRKVFDEWRAEAPNAEDERRRVAAGLASIAQAAMKARDYGPAVRAAEVRARVLGLLTERVEVKGKIAHGHLHAAINLAELEASDLDALDAIAERMRQRRPELPAAADPSESEH